MSGWETRLGNLGWSGWPKGSTRQYILIDEAQDSYWDKEFWNDFLEGVRGTYKGIRVILFCSYGNLSNRPNAHPSFTPLNIPSVACVSLRPQNASEIGLLLTRGEYDDLLGNHPKVLKFDDDLKCAIYEWTAGHVGAVEALIGIILHTVVASHQVHPISLTERGVTDCRWHTQCVLGYPARWMG